MRKIPRMPLRLWEDFEDPRVRRLIGTAERLVSERAASTSNAEKDQADDILDIVYFLAAYLDDGSPPPSYRRTLRKMAAVRTAVDVKTGEERLIRAKLIVESLAPSIRAERDPVKRRRRTRELARHIERETGDGAFRTGVKGDAACDLAADLFLRWTEGRPTKGKLSTNGLLAQLAEMFRLWNLTARSALELKDTIKRRVYEAERSDEASARGTAVRRRRIKP